MTFGSGLFHGDLLVMAVVGPQACEVKMPNLPSSEFLGVSVAVGPDDAILEVSAGSHRHCGVEHVLELEALGKPQEIEHPQKPHLRHSHARWRWRCKL